MLNRFQTRHDLQLIRDQGGEIVGFIGFYKHIETLYARSEKVFLVFVRKKLKLCPWSMDIQSIWWN